MSKAIRAVRYDQLEGKIVSGAGFNRDTMIVAFTDGTVLALSAEHDCTEGAEIDFEQLDIQLEGKWLECAKEAGLVSREEYLAEKARSNERRAKHLKERLKYLRGDK